jgi:protein-L-isoaspartate(D-aspartate) O-methyltransferase
VKEVYTVEIIASLSLRAQAVLGKLGYRHIYFKIGDGTFGWEENSPYEAIMVTAAPARIPQQLERQLKPGGRLVIPVGSAFQDLYLVTREKDGFKRKKLLPVRFVPLITTH